ncbi:MAG TPA: TonB-dependent receptor [Dyadobacter sp.]|nr:TonB-dependent receptor [Dyadobacter sp.]
MIRTILLLFLSVNFVFAQEFTSVVRGSVKDADTGQPLAQATVQLDDKGSITDQTGLFRFEGIGVGRHTLRVSFVGYQTLVIQEILLESGKENVQEIRLSATGRQLQEATVSGSREPAFNSVQAITAEQTLRYAATYLDPARVATSFAGVAAANDQANGLVVRGNSPNSMQWRLEGVEIVNPNHLSNAGTFSDRPTSTGGGVNILSTQLMGTSYFMSGPFPAQYGNAMSAILDMSLRKGNNEKKEFTAQAGLIGLDIAAEGPLSNSHKGSYLVNYRYSFTGLLGAMGVNFGGEDIRFQDLSWNVSIPTKGNGNFTFFGLGGVSSNDFKADADSLQWENDKDAYNIKYKNKMGALGVTLTQPIGTRGTYHAAFALSGLNTTRVATPMYATGYQYGDIEGNSELTNSKISANTSYSHRFNPDHKLTFGTLLLFQKSGRPPLFMDESLHLWTVQPYVNWTWKISESLTADVGLHGMISKIRSDRADIHATAEPRVAIRWASSTDTRWSFSYGLHSQLQSADLYTAYYGMTNTYRNLQLAPTRGHYATLGYQRNLSGASLLKIEAYLQSQFDVPVSSYDRVYSAVNLVEQIPNLYFENKGKALNYGVEVTYQKLLTNQFYLLATGSLYKATYSTAAGPRQNSRFDGRHTLSLTGGKEIKSGERSIWGFNAKILWIGGFRERPIDEEYSRKLNFTIESSSIYSVKLRDYFRPDLRIYWKKSHRAYNRTLALDLQNVSGTQNEAYHRYDAFQRKVVVQKQLGLIPVLSYRWEF